MGYINKWLACLFLIGVSSHISAQDIIVKKDGTVIKAVVTKITETEIEYRKFGTDTGRIYSVGIKNILSVCYADGTVDKFTVATGGACESDNRKSEPDVEVNRASMDAVNYSDVSYDSITPGRKAHYSILKFAVAPNSVLVSDDLSVSAETGCIHGPFTDSKTDGKRYDSYYTLWKDKRTWVYYDSFPAMKFYIRNRTDHILYLDLGNTFLSIGERACPFYIPGGQSSSMSTSTSSKLLKVLDRELAAVMEGVKSSTDVVYNQRVIALPPFSKISLEAQVVEDGSLIICKDGRPVEILYSEPIMQGESIEFSEESTPLKLRFILSYSSTEDCAKLKYMESVFFVRSIYGFGGFGTTGVSPKPYKLTPESLPVFSRIGNTR